MLDQQARAAPCSDSVNYHRFISAVLTGNTVTPNMVLCSSNDTLSRVTTINLQVRVALVATFRA